MKIRNLVLPSIALGAAFMLATPKESKGWSTLGFSLSPGQSDFRVHNNFLDSQANNNTNPNENFPGYTGAVMAIWKGAVEWASGPHGDGSGDPHQGILGSGNSSFDPIFNGEANGVGTIGNNIVSSLNQSGGGTLAFMQGGSSGWWIRFHENWTWADGPGTNVGFNTDMQGVACHEFGHAFGLGHSFAGGTPTMQPSISGSGVTQRSITTDDQAGLQAVYGVANNSGTKPTITALQYLGTQVRIFGTNFTTNNNQVWFTRATPGSNGGSGGDPIKVTGLSSENGNTEILVTIPSTAGPGDILVKRNSSGQESTSAAWPFDPATVPPPIPTISSIVPSQVAPLEAGTQGGGPTVVLTGSGFIGASSLVVNDKLVGDPGNTFTGSWNVDSDTQITFNMPLTGTAGLVDVDLTTPGGPISTQIEIVNAPSPVLEVNSPSLIQSVGIGLATTAEVNDIVVLQFSVVDGPTSIPGLFELEIGGGSLSNIFDGKVWTIGPKFWRKLDSGPLSNLQIGLTIYFEGLVYEFANGYGFPLGSTNKTQVLVIA